jgi:hypothetical protein
MLRCDLLLADAFLRCGTPGHQALLDPPSQSSRTPAPRFVGDIAHDYLFARFGGCGTLPDFRICRSNARRDASEVLSHLSFGLRNRRTP